MSYNYYLICPNCEEAIYLTSNKAEPLDDEQQEEMVYFLSQHGAHTVVLSNDLNWDMPTRFLNNFADDKKKSDLEFEKQERRWQLQEKRKQAAIKLGEPPV